MSSLLRSNPGFQLQAYESNNKIFSDSLKEKPPLAASDSTIVLNNDSVLRTTLDTLHHKDSTMMLVTDTIHKKDTVQLAEDSEIKDVINYKANDSIVYDMNTRRMLLYNTVDVKYQKIKLDAGQT